MLRHIVELVTMCNVLLEKDIITAWGIVQDPGGSDDKSVGVWIRLKPYAAYIICNIWMAEDNWMRVEAMTIDDTPLSTRDIKEVTKQVLEYANRYKSLEEP